MRKHPALVYFIILTIGVFFLTQRAAAQPLWGSRSKSTASLTISGKVVNTQNLGISKVEIQVYDDQTPLAFQVNGEKQTTIFTKQDGSFLAKIARPVDIEPPLDLTLHTSKQGFQAEKKTLTAQDFSCQEGTCFSDQGRITLHRILNQAFFVATGIFIFIFGLISFNLLHETIAAFLGAASMLGISYFLGNSDPNFWIIGFYNAIQYIDFDVIFLLLAMMIFMAIMSQTGIFQWLAYQTFKIGRGDPFQVAVILISITGITSAVLNDTTVMLLMAPISIQIALALNIRPEAIVIPEILASNIGGSATLIGTPPNTIIGSYVGIGFTEMLVNMLPISIISMVILVWMTRWLFQDQFQKKDEVTSMKLIQQLEKSSKITNQPLLIKSSILFGLTLILFFVEDQFHMPPAVAALIGAAGLLLWVQPNVGEMLKEVDWTTLVFFMTLFMMIGGIQEVGLIQLIAESVQDIAGENLILATLLIIWVAAIASGIVANIPFTAAIVPVTVFLTSRIPGAENNVLYWALSLGAGLGGNATYIGSAPNIVAVGIMDRAGYKVSFADYARIGVPITFVTILVSTIWILTRYLWIGF
jgi:Na+/H+ antiporter NhaD/arsenite permease-like protein